MEKINHLIADYKSDIDALSMSIHTKELLNLTMHYTQDQTLIEILEKIHGVPSSGHISFKSVPQLLSGEIENLYNCTDEVNRILKLYSLIDSGIKDHAAKLQSYKAILNKHAMLFSRKESIDAFLQ